MREQHEKHPSNAALVLCSVGMAVTNTSRWHILACSKAGRSSSFGSMMALLTRVLLSALSSCPPLSSGLSCSVSLLATILHLPQQHGWPLALAPLAAPADPSVAVCSVFLPSMLMLPAVLAFTPRNNPPPAARQPSTRAATTLHPRRDNTATLPIRSPLSSLGFTPGTNFVVPVWMRLQPLRTAAVGCLLPPDLPCRCAGMSCFHHVMVLIDRVWLFILHTLGQASVTYMWWQRCTGYWLCCP